MAEGGNNQPNDQLYQDLCDNVDQWVIAMGGDSHGRNICDAMFTMLGYDRYDEGVRLAHPCNFAVGGRRAMSYMGDPMFLRLRGSLAPIIVLELGGNDLDMELSRPWTTVVVDILTLFSELSRAGKIVYIVGLPWRHSSRWQDVPLMKSKIQHINRKLKRDLNTRFIAIPPPCYPIASFAVSARGERVHLRPEFYEMAADRILFRINMDLHNRRTPTSMVMRKVNQTLESFF